MGLTAKNAAIGAAVAIVVIAFVYFYRKSNQFVSCYVWDSYDPSAGPQPLGILGGAATLAPVGVRGADGAWHLGNTTTDISSPNWGKVSVPSSGVKIAATQIWYLRLRDWLNDCPFRPMMKTDKQVMFNGIPVCYSVSGSFATSAGGVCSQDSAFAPFAPIADVSS
jgi:hypothetical protein